jgi:hypothetical protein
MKSASGFWRAGSFDVLARNGRPGHQWKPPSPKDALQRARSSNRQAAPPTRPPRNEHSPRRRHKIPPVDQVPSLTGSERPQRMTYRAQNLCRKNATTVCASVWPLQRSNSSQLPGKRQEKDATKLLRGSSGLNRLSSLPLAVTSSRVIIIGLCGESIVLQSRYLNIAGLR